MTQQLVSPRTTLHHLPPIRLSTEHVESLTSYFCRLAQSHSVSARNLAAWILQRNERTIPSDFKWFRRALSGSTQETQNWAAWLAALTGVEGLDRLTLAPWCDIVAPARLTAKTDRWCLSCLQDDLKTGQTPFLRLLWDIAEVDVCPRHWVKLINRCPSCSNPKARHRASTVLPGYCTRCGEFLGKGQSLMTHPIRIWIANEVGRMISCQPQLRTEQIAELLEEIIAQRADGSMAKFAKLTDMTKSAVFHWLKKDGKPTLRTWIRIAHVTQQSVKDLFEGIASVSDCVGTPGQHPLPLPRAPRAGIKARVLNWGTIRAALESMLVVDPPPSLAKVCQALDVDIKLVYLNATDLARKIVGRLKMHEQKIGEARTVQTQEHLRELHQRRGGTGMSARELWPELPEKLKNAQTWFSKNTRLPRRQRSVDRQAFETTKGPTSLRGDTGIH